MLDCHLYATPIPFNQTTPDYKVCNELTTVFNKALQKEPDKRHQTVSEFGEEFAEALRRDAVKLKAYRHRLQTSEFTDLASEAQALSKHLYDSGKLETLPPQQADALLDGVQFMQEPGKGGGIEPRAALRPTDRKLLETEPGLLEKMQKSLASMVGEGASSKHGWKRCPYCDEPCEPGIRFCLNCKRQFISQEEAARLKYAQEADSNGGQKGFSKRAKSATAGSMTSAMNWVVALAGVLLVCAGVGGYVAYTNGALGKIFPALAPHKVETTEQTEDTTTDDTTAGTDKPGTTTDSTPTTSKGTHNSSKRKSQTSSLHNTAR
jgi:hypothetical protein